LKYYISGLNCIFNNLNMQTRDEKIDIVLSDFKSNPSISIGDYLYYKFGDPNNMDNRNECKIIIRVMEENDLIASNDGNIYFIRPKGIEILDKGGWIKYVENKKRNKDSLIAIKVKEAEKITKETKLLKWQIKTFWPLFVIAVVGSLMGFISLVWQIFNTLSK